MRCSIESRARLGCSALVAIALFGALPSCGDDSSSAVEDAAAPRDETLVVPVPPLRDSGGPIDSGPTPVDADRGPCAPAGATREIPCGRCGIASQTCEADGRWSEPTACFDESGECVAGTVEASCGRERLCRSDCSWTDWNGERVGECEPGEMMSSTEGCAASESRMLLCSADCVFEAMGGCGAACARPARPSRSGGDPVCIPAGPFVLGSLELPDTQPVQTIVMSDYWIDRLPVSKRRYVMCMDDGACPPIEDWNLPLFEMTGDDDAAGFFSYPNGHFAFCEWDGGRVQSSFEYEKAARGPAPDDRRHAWGDDDGTDCVHHPGVGCPASSPLKNR